MEGAPSAKRVPAMRTLVEILYGLPDFERVPDNVIWGGCVFMDGASPLWHWTKCDGKFSDREVGYQRPSPGPEILGEEVLGANKAAQNTKS